MKYPSDNFYKGYSLSFDFGKTGKDEYLFVKKRLSKLGVPTNEKNVVQSLHSINNLHKFVKKYGIDEQNKIAKYDKKFKVTGNVVPVDLWLAYETFSYIVELLAPFFTAGSQIYTGYKIIRKLKEILNSKNTRITHEKQIINLIKKQLRQDKKGLVSRQIIRLFRKSKKKNSTKTKIVKKEKTKKHTKK